MKETWKQIPGWPFYEASTLGNIRSLQKGSTPWPIKPFSNKYGRHVVTLTNGLNRKKHCRLWSRVIMETFHGASEMQVNHINGIKTDNRLENLEYTTHRENADHAIAHGLYPKGSKNGQAKLTEKQVVEIWKSKERNFIIAKRFDVTPSTIWDIRNGKTWSHLTKELGLGL